jgi:hypothetical protein
VVISFISGGIKLCINYLTTVVPLLKDHPFCMEFLTSISLHVKIIDLPEIVYLFIKLNTVAIVPLL